MQVETRRWEKRGTRSSGSIGRRASAALGLAPEPIRLLHVASIGGVRDLRLHGLRICAEQSESSRLVIRRTRGLVQPACAGLPEPHTLGPNRPCHRNSVCLVR